MKQLIIVICILSTAFMSCESIDKWTQFDMEFNESIVVPAATNINLPIDILTPDISSNATSTFELNNTTKDLVESIILKQLNLNLSQPTSSDLSFLKSIEIFISAEGLSEIRIAWVDDVPDNVGTNLALQTAENDFQAYVKKDQFSLRVATVTDKLITADHHIDINAVFFVDAKILGI